MMLSLEKYHIAIVVIVSDFVRVVYNNPNLRNNEQFDKEQL